MSALVVTPAAQGAVFQKLFEKHGIVLPKKIRPLVNFGPNSRITLIPRKDTPYEKIVDHMVDSKQWIVGTPDDCINAIEELQEMSGGFGRLMIRVEDWTTREKNDRSYEMVARYVMPHFQGSLEGIIASNNSVKERKGVLSANQLAGLQRATDSYDEAKGRAKVS